MAILKTLAINGVVYNVMPAIPSSSVTLSASKWIGSGGTHSQVVALVGVTPYTKVDLHPTAEQLAEFSTVNVAFVTENEDGVVTVFAIGEKPTKDYAIPITLTEVTA